MTDYKDISYEELEALRAQLWKQHEEVRAQAVEVGKELNARRNDPVRKLEKQIAEAQAELAAITPPEPPVPPKPTLIVRMKTLFMEAIHGGR